MSQDLAEILTGQAPARATSPAPAKPPAKTYDPVDAAIRTVYGESLPDATKEERQAIAAVIANRAKASGKTYDQVVQEPGQFEPWNDTKARARLDALTPDDPVYQAIAADVNDILAGTANPYPGLTHFYAPEAQTALGREKPGWDDGTGQQIGSHLFFAKGVDAPKADGLASVLGAGGDDAAAEAAFAQQFGDPAKFAEATYVGAGVIPFANLKGSLNKPQTETFETLVKGGSYDPDAPVGSINNPPFLAAPEAVKNVPPGSYFVDDKGKLQRAPGGEEKSSFTKGFGQGAADVALSLGQILPGTEDSEIRARLEAGQMGYAADYGGDLKSGLGRFAGQVVTSLPLIAGGEAVVAPRLAASGLGRFAMGNAGRVALPETAGAAARAGQLATRAGSLATAGAGEGAASAALVSSANDAPLTEQMKTGAILGSILRPAAGAAQAGMRRFVGGPQLQGAAPIPVQTATVAAAQGLPVPVPMSLGQITGAPAQQMAENALLRGAEGDIAAGVMQAFRGEQQAALRGNVDAISGQMGGRPVATGEAGRGISEKLGAMRTAAEAEVDAAYAAARAQGENAMLANAKDGRDAMLTVLRENYDLEAIPNVARVVERFGEGGAPTARELFEARTRLVNLQAAGGVEGGAASKTKRALDSFIDRALKEDLFLGDPAAVDAWRTAIGKRAAVGKLFEGDDLIENLTEQVQRGGGSTLKVDPEEATNYILNRSSLGFIGKKNLGRDLKRLQTVLGKDSDEWNALRAEVFLRIARAGEGAPEGGAPQFSGQNFMKAWEKVKREDPQVTGVIFTPEERKLINEFAEVAQKVTTPVKGGDNPSNTAITAKGMLGPLMNFLATSGGAGGGAAVGGIPGAAAGAALGSLFKTVREVLSAGKAKNVTYGAKPMVEEQLRTRLIPGSTLPAAGGVAGAATAQ